jgi:hypothetical protein
LMRWFSALDMAVGEVKPSVLVAICEASELCDGGLFSHVLSIVRAAAGPHQFERSWLYPVR